jgi:hypothetical protein
MKITKQKLKQIIREELREAGSRGPKSRRYGYGYVEADEPEEAFGTTEPRYTEGAVSPEQQLVNALFVRSRIENMSPEEVAETLNLEPTEEMLAYIQQMQEDPYDDPAHAGSSADPGREEFSPEGYGYD